MIRRREPLLRVLLGLGLDVRRCVVAVAAGSAALLCAVALAATSSWLVTRAAQMPPVLTLSVAVVSVRALGIGRGVFRYLERTISHDVALAGTVTLRTTVYSRLALAPAAAVARLRRGDLLARLGADVDALADLVVRVLLPVAVALVTGAASAVLAVWLLPAAGAVLAGALVVGGAGSLWLSARAAQRAEVDAAQARGAVAAEALAALDGAEELRVGGQLGAREAALAAAQARLDAAMDAAAVPAAAARALVQLCLGVTVVGALLVSAPLVGTGEAAATGGELTATVFAVVALLPLAAFEAVSALPGAGTSLVRCRAAAQRVLALVDAAPDAGAPEPTSGPSGDLAHRGHVLVSDLVCGWPDAPATSRGLDLDLAPGATLAVVGPSGCGKTTLLSTLAGLVPPRSGSVLVDGDAPGALDDAERAHRVSLAAEDGHVFATSVRENLLVAAPFGTPDPELVAVLEQVGLRAWVLGLTDGLNTLLGSGGTDIAGGERRRMLVARSLLSGAAVLLLDEPTEHLDEAAADALVRDLLAAAKGRTVVVATHRRASLGEFDAVLDLEPHEAVVPT